MFDTGHYPPYLERGLIKQLCSLLEMLRCRPNQSNPIHKRVKWKVHFVLQDKRSKLFCCSREATPKYVFCQPGRPGPREEKEIGPHTKKMRLFSMETYMNCQIETVSSYLPHIDTFVYPTKAYRYKQKLGCLLFIILSKFSYSGNSIFMSMWFTTQTKRNRSRCRNRLPGRAVPPTSGCFIPTAK